jgi:hypothetical protein
MMRSFIKQLFPYNAKSIKEFVNKLDKNNKIKVVATINDKSKVANADKPRYEMTHQFSTEFRSYMPDGRPITLTKQYSYDSDRAIKNTMRTLDYICGNAPNTKPGLTNSDGREVTSAELAIIKAYIDNI